MVVCYHFIPSWTRTKFEALLCPSAPCHPPWEGPCDETHHTHSVLITLIKYGSVSKPTIMRAYICLFVSLSVKAVHLELVLDLTADAFIASLRHFVARRGKPSLIWSDHVTNFVDANRELKEFVEFLEHQKIQGAISFSKH